MPVFLILVALIVTLIAWRRGLAREGLQEAVKLLVQVGPALVTAFILAGMVSVLLSPELLNAWLGTGAGFRGLLLGTVAGAVTPGGPFVAFPLIAVLLKGGASMGVLTAFLSSWALLGMHRVLAYELPILGPRFVICRIVASLFFPVAIGFLAQQLWTRFAGQA